MDELLHGLVPDFSSEKDEIQSTTTLTTVAQTTTTTTTTTVSQAPIPEENNIVSRWVVPIIQPIVGIFLNFKFFKFQSFATFFENIFLEKF